jgi:septum formation protein
MLSIPYQLVLGSKSPRRREIMKMAGFDFRVLDIECEETLPEAPFKADEIPLYLAKKKAASVRDRRSDELLITADTLVFLEDKIIGKPKDRDDAFRILSELSGKMHRVISGVYLVSDEQEMEVTETTRVYFKALELEELEYYIDNYPVMDKAGAYGVQDWIGLIGVEKIEGSFFNVMGFPIDKVYEALKNMAEHRK